MSRTRYWSIHSLVSIIIPLRDYFAMLEVFVGSPKSVEWGLGNGILVSRGSAVGCTIAACGC